MPKQIKRTILLSLVLTAFNVLNASAWVEPPADGTNIFAPINTSSTAQTKQGALTVSGQLSLGGNAIMNQNTYLRIGNDTTAAYLSSGGDYVHISNNEYYAGSWVRNGRAGALIQLTGQNINFYKHDGVSGTSHTNLAILNSSGTLTVTGNVSAQTFYDRDDNTYYLNPATNSRLNTLTTVGNITAPAVVDSNNTAYYLNPDAGSLIYNLTLNGVASIPRVYDKDNTAYFTDPAGTSNLNALTVNGQITIKGGAPGAGKVLTSDATGLGSWQTPSNCPSGFTLRQSYAHGGNVAHTYCSKDTFNDETSCVTQCGGCSSSSYGAKGYARYMNGERYTRATLSVVGYGSCDSGYIKGEAASCSYGMYTSTAAWTGFTNDGIKAIFSSSSNGIALGSCSNTNWDVSCYAAECPPCGDCFCDPLNWSCFVGGIGAP